MRRRSVLAPRRRRATEATVAQQIAATGGWAAGYDPVDGDTGYRQAGGSGQQRPVPWATVEAARAQSVTFYRAHPMARSIIDTYTAFCVGDTGVRPMSVDPEVQRVLDEFWTHPLVDLGNRQDELLRSHLLYGETLLEALVGEVFGSVRLRPIDVTAVQSITNRDGNPWWPETVNVVLSSGQTLALPVVAWDEMTGLRQGQAFWRADWRAVSSDTRGTPFLMPVLDWLGAYDRVLWNLVDRTALARYVVFHVKVDGDQDAVDDYVARRGTLDPPESGSVEVTNEQVEWKAITPAQAAYEDSTTAGNILTTVSGGVGLARPWMADSEGANRAVAVTMAEPVRRRVQNVQSNWLALQGEICRFVVDQAVARGLLPRFITLPDARDGQRVVEAWRTVQIVGPEVAVTDAQINATIIANLAGSLGQLVSAGLLGPESARRLVERAWSDFMGQPWEPGQDGAETVQAWLDMFGSAPTVSAPGAMSGVDNAAGSDNPNPPGSPTDATVNTGAPT